MTLRLGVWVTIALFLVLTGKTGQGEPLPTSPSPFPEVDAPSEPPEPPNPYILPKGHRTGDASRLYDTAVDLMRQQQWRHALVALLELRKSPHLATWNYRTSLLIGVALTRLGRDEEAVTWLVKTAPVFENLRTDIFLWIAEAFYRLERYKEARTYYRRAILEFEKVADPAGVALREWPAYHDAQVREVECVLNEGRPADSIRLGTEVIKDYRRRYGEDAEVPFISKILWFRALAHRELGRFKQEADLLATIKLVHPECPAYDDALLRLDILRMEGITPELEYSDALVRHANRLRVLWQHGPALDLIDESEALYPPGSTGYDPAIHERLAFVKARTLLAAGRNEEAVALFQWLCEKPEARPEEKEDYLSSLARALGRVNRIEEASDAYARVAALYPKSSRATQSAFMAAWLLAHLPEHRERADGMLDAFHRANPRTLLGRKALWFRAWFAYRNGDLDTAYERFARLHATYPRTEYETAGRYWLGRIHELRGEAGKAKSFYLSLATSERPGYYRMAAESRLLAMRVPDPDVPLPQPLDPILIDPVEPEPTGIAALDGKLAAWTDAWEQMQIDERDRAALGTQDLRAALVAYLTELRTWAASGTSKWRKVLEEQADVWKEIYPDLSRAVALERLGLEAEAAEALGRFSEIRRAQAASRKSPLAGGEEADDRVTLFKLRQEATRQAKPELNMLLLRQFVLLDDLAHAFRLYSSTMSSEERRQMPSDLRHRFFYPMVHHQQVWRATDNFGMPDEIVYAVMRTESYFNPLATSEVNAMGLMQIMPHTGMKISMRLGEERFERDRLYQPQTAIRFGVWYLAQLTRKFDGQTPLAAAAYNGGPHNVVTWLERNPGLEWDEFIESIEFEQTRNYVKKVLTVAAAYRRAYGLDSRVWDLAQPLRYTHHDTIDF